MLILHTDQVKFCQVTHHDAAENHLLDAFTYLERLFIKGESFEEQKQALSRTQELLDMEEDVWGVLLKEEHGFSLWYCSGKLENNQSIETISRNPKTETKAKEHTSPSEKNHTEEKFSKLILSRIKKEWEDSFRLKH